MRVERNDHARFGLDEFLSRPLMAHLATTAPEGARDTPLWFVWEDGALWFITEIGYNTVHERVARDPRVSVGIVDFDPRTGHLQHVGLRGIARLEPWDDDRGNRLLYRYYRCGEGYSGGPPGPGEPCTGPRPMKFLRVEPQSVVLREQSYVPSERA